MTQMDEAGFSLLRQREGLILYAYDDANDQPVKPGQHVLGTLTIGYGHTGSDVYPGLVWTQEEAEEALEHDVAAFGAQIAPLIKTNKLNDNQFSAFVCFSFNIGLHAFAGSAALHLANAGNLVQVPAAMMLWDKTTINGQLVVSKGLQNRRQAEIDLWNKP